MTQSAAIKEGLKNGKDEAGVMTDVKKRASDTLEKGVEVAQETATQASEQAKVAVDQAKVAVDQAGEEIRKLAETGTQFVRENPGAAVAGAVGVGILVGLALRGRD